VGEIASHVQRLTKGINIKKGSIVLDLGANRGDFAVWASNKGATVFAFEPNPFALKYLYKRIKRLTNVAVVPFAVSDASGIASFFDHPNSESDPLGFSIRSSLSQKDSSFVSNFRVFKLSLEPFLEGLDRIDCVKIDIEGEESNIFPLIKKYFRKIEYCLIEVHDDINPQLREEINVFIQRNQLEGKWSTDWV